LIPRQYIMKFMFSKLFIYLSIWYDLSWNFYFKFFANGYPFLLCSKNFFSNSMQMGSHISFLFKNFFFEVLCKLVPISSFLKISMKLQVANPTHEQIKFVQSSIKWTQVWSSIKNFFFPNKSITNTKRNHVVCNQSLCNCMQLGVVCNYIGCVCN